MPDAPPAASPTTSPRVSVVVTCYNLGEYLTEAVDSLLAQTFSDLEIVIVDDGSTDSATVRLLETFERARTRIVRSENRGLPAARNFGLRHTCGEYVCCFDADDRAAPTLVEASVAALDADPSLAFVSHWLRTFGDEEGDWTPTDCGFPALLDVNTVNGAALVRRSVLDAVGGYDETFRQGCEDWDLWITLVARGFRGAILPEVLFHYRRRPGSMSQRMVAGGSHASLYRRLVEKHEATFRLHLPALLDRRDRDLLALRREIGQMEHDYPRVLAPAVQSRRDDLAALDRHREIDRRHRESAALAARAAELTAEVAALRTRDEELVAEVTRLEGCLDEAVARQTRTVRQAADDLHRTRARHQQDVSILTNEVASLRASWSWRVTWPLRVIYRLLTGAGAPR